MRPLAGGTTMHCISLISPTGQTTGLFLENSFVTRVGPTVGVKLKLTDFDYFFSPINLLLLSLCQLGFGSLQTFFSCPPVDIFLMAAP